MELFRHKERIRSAAGLSSGELEDALYVLTSQIHFVSENRIPLETWMEAYRLCRGVDADDTPYIALTLHLKGLLWTEDQQLIAGLRSRGFTGVFGS